MWISRECCMCVGKYIFLIPEPSCSHMWTTAPSGALTHERLISGLQPHMYRKPGVSLCLESQEEENIQTHLL